jgi:hypothetical protein
MSSEGPYGRQGFQSNPNGYGSPPGGAGYGGGDASYGAPPPGGGGYGGGGGGAGYGGGGAGYAAPQPGAYGADLGYQVCVWKKIFVMCESSCAAFELKKPMVHRTCQGDQHSN